MDGVARDVSRGVSAATDDSCVSNSGVMDSVAGVDVGAGVGGSVALVVLAAAE